MTDRTSLWIPDSATPIVPMSASHLTVPVSRPVPSKPASVVHWRSAAGIASVGTRTERRSSEPAGSDPVVHLPASHTGNSPEIGADGHDGNATRTERIPESLHPTGEVEP